MTLLQQSVAAGDQNLINQVQMAAYQEAVIIMDENSGTTNHAARATYALSVLNGAVNFTTLTKILMAQPAAAGVTAPTDAQLVAFLASLWNNLSSGTP